MEKLYLENEIAIFEIEIETYKTYKTCSICRSPLEGSAFVVQEKETLVDLHEGFVCSICAHEGAWTYED